MSSNRIYGSGGGSSKSSSSSSQPATIPQEAPNTLQSKSTARILDALGEGPIKGLVNGQQSIFLNDTPLQNSDGSFNFAGVATDFRTGLPTQASMSGFAFVEREVAVGVTVLYGTPIVRTIIDASIDAVRIKIQVPSLTKQASNGQLVGYSIPFLIEVQANGGSYIPINLNYGWIAMAGTQTVSTTATGIRVTAKATLTGLVGTTQSTTLTVNYRIVGAGSWTQLGTRLVTGVIPSGGVSVSGSLVVSATFELSGLSAAHYEYQITSGTVASAFELQETPLTITGKTTSPYEVQYRTELPAGGAPWNIRVSRTTMQSLTLTIQDALIFSGYTEVIDSKLQYPDTAYVGITVDAQLFGQSVPTRSFDVYGLMIQIPSNYNPVTRVYTGIWDGTFTTDYTNNPAWVLYDLLTNTRYGIGNDVLPGSVDKFALYAIAQYCDGMIDDGFGGLEPRFTFNGVLNTLKDVYTVINAIASAFRGMTFWASGSVTAVMDAPSDPVKLVTPANVIDGKFSYAGSALKARHTAAIVTWNDPNNNYKTALEVVEDPDGIRQFGWRQSDTVAFGCTSRGQAHRFGKWILDSEKYETDVVTYTASLDHYDVRPGDLIKVADPAYSNVQYGGRLSDYSLGSYYAVTLDRSITITDTDVFLISIVMPDGSVAQDLPISNAPGTTNIITFTSPLPASPVDGAMWVMTSSSVTPRLFRVISVRETEKNEWEIVALFHDPNKYTRVESNITLKTIPYTAFPTGPILPPTNLGLQEFLYQAGVNVSSGITLSWTPPHDSRVSYYTVAYQGPNDPGYINQQTVTGTSVDISGLALGAYNFRVASVTNAGIKSAYTVLSGTLAGLTAAPSDVTNFNLSTVGDVTYLTWDPIPDLDIANYSIKYSTLTSGATWGTAFAIGPLVSKGTTSIIIPSRVGTYFIKSIDTGGRESVNAAILETTVPGLTALNVVATVTEDPTFSGTKTNCHVVSSNLKMVTADVLTPGLYYCTGSGGATGSAYDLGDVYSSRLTAMVTAFGSDLLSNVDLWDNIDLITNWDGADPSQWSIQLQVRTTLTNPTTSPVWTDWANFTVGDYVARAFQFRVYLYANQTGISPVISNLSINIDMPDRVLGNNGVSCLSGGSTITYTDAFRATPALAITGTGLSTGDYFTLTSEAATGFHLQFFNSSNTGVARTFNWVAKGYGKLS